MLLPGLLIGTMLGGSMDPGYSGGGEDFVGGLGCNDGGGDGGSGDFGGGFGDGGGGF
jgi:hypothetical protein